MKPKDRWYLSFGSTLHRCTEYFFKIKAPPPPSLEALLKFYEQNWISSGYESSEDESNCKAYGSAILKKFWEIHSFNFNMPLAVEKMFYIDIDGVPLRGFIDRVDKLESGGLSIIDYKTSKELFTNDYLANDLQLTLYQSAAEQIWQIPVDKLTLYHLRSNTSCSCRARDDKTILQVRQLVIEVAEKIASSKFPATENDFCPCDFDQYCPYHRQKYIPLSQQAVLPGLAAAEAVESYVSLNGQIKDLEMKLEQARQVIVNFCQSEKINRVYGAQHAITYHLIERADYNEDEVRNILIEAGLWAQASSFDQPKLRALLADGTVSRELSQKIESLRQVTSRYPQLRVKKLQEEDR